MAIDSVPVGFRIKENRRAKGLTQAGMARDLGISPSYLNLIEANKRTISGRLLNDIARMLELDLDALTGRTQRQLIVDLVEAVSDPAVGHLGAEAAAVPELVGRFPAWAEALRNTLRTANAQAEAIDALSNRVAQDPELSDALYRIVTHVTAIRSTAEILDGGQLPPEMRRRFEGMVSEETADLAETAQAIVRYFDRPESGQRPSSPIEEVDDYFIANSNHFPALEDAGSAMRAVLDDFGATLDEALRGYLMHRHGIVVETESSTGANLALFDNQSRYEAAESRLYLLDNAAQSTQRFQIAQLATSLFAADAIEAQAAGGTFSGDVSLSRARRALASYTASACLFPYAAFLRDAEAFRYDIEQLRQRYAASFEQAAHRLVTLRRPGAEGVPFGFLRADPAGFLSKRFPLAGLQVPRSGAGCPLWGIYVAFQTPGRIVRQLVEFPNRGRFLLIARSVTKDPARFHEEPFLRSVMLACDAIHADRTVYGDGLDLSSRELTVPVGPGCRLCARTDCQHRAEDAILTRI